MVRGGTQGKFIDHELWSPYALGSNYLGGMNIAYEPLAFYSASPTRRRCGWPRATSTARTSSR